MNRIVSWVLLAYFALFVVPPVSTFAGSHELPGNGVFGEGRGIERPHREVPLFLFDVILWQHLKETRHSQEFLASDPGHDDSGPGRMPFFDTFDLPQSASNLLSDDANGGTFYFLQSRSSSIRFTKSGISPPAFSL